MIVNHPKLGAVEIVCNRLNQIHLRATGFTFNRVEYRQASLHVWFVDGATTKYTNDAGKQDSSSPYVSRMNLADVKWEQRQALETILLEIAQKFFDNKNNLVERWQGEVTYHQRSVWVANTVIESLEEQLAAKRKQKQADEKLALDAADMVKTFTNALREPAIT